jgi:hypothetical protein
MTSKFLLAILLGFVLRFIASLGIMHYIKTCKTDEEMRSKIGFHITAISYMVGTFLKYGGFILLFAYLIKEHLL